MPRPKTPYLTPKPPPRVRPDSFFRKIFNLSDGKYGSVRYLGFHLGVCSILSLGVLADAYLFRPHKYTVRIENVEFRKEYEEFKNGLPKIPTEEELEQYWKDFKEAVVAEIADINRGGPFAKPERKESNDTSGKKS